MKAAPSPHACKMERLCRKLLWSPARPGPLGFGYEYLAKGQAG